MRNCGDYGYTCNRHDDYMHVTGNKLRHRDSLHFLWGKHLQCIYLQFIFQPFLGQSIKVYPDYLYFLVILQEMNSVWIFSALTHFSFSMFLLYFFGVGPMLHVQSTINSRKKVLTKAIWADKNVLVSDRLACTSRKTEILNRIGI